MGLLILKIFWLSSGKNIGIPIINERDVIQMLAAIQRGEPQAAEELLPLVYAELRKLAASRMAQEAPGQTLQPTALVHEAWLRLLGNQNPRFEGRAHFFAAAAEAMRRILIDKARRKKAQRHGGGQQRVDIDELDLPAPDGDDQLLMVNEALDCLAVHHPRQAEVVKLRFFVGMTVEETAEVLGVSVDTVKDSSAYARAWLFREISKGTRSDV